MGSADDPTSRSGPGGIFLLFLRLGCLAFGGPVAHLALFRRELVEQRRWVDDQAYADLVAFCQFLPGPASSQVGMGLGLHRGGVAGMLAAWAGFTVPAATALTVAALFLHHLDPATPGLAGALRGLHAAVLAVVAWAVWGMAVKLCPDRPRQGIAVFAAVLMLVIPEALMQLAVIAGAGLLGAALVRLLPSPPVPEAGAPVRARRAGVTALTLAVLLAAGLCGAAWLTPHALWHLFAVHVQAGSLVFGGGHVVLPLLLEAVVPSGLVTEQAFLAGYGITQAMPGPIFAFSAFLGASAFPGAWSIPAAAVAVLGIFLPSFFLVGGLWPLWQHLRRHAVLRAALQGVAAAVVGLLLAACWDPIMTQVIEGPVAAQALALALTCFGLLGLLRWPPWVLVPLAGGVGAVSGLCGMPGWQGY